MLDQLENEKQNNIKSVTLIATLEEEKEQLELIVHNLDVGREDLELAGMEMEKELEHLKDKLQVCITFYQHVTSFVTYFLSSLLHITLGFNGGRSTMGD